jgi:RNA polymerase sigma-70 factor (ECF subfamily)
MDERVQQFSREAAAGSLQAFDELVRLYSGRIMTFCRGKSARGAEDLAQEVFVTAYRRLKSYNPSRPFGPWLFAVARRVAIDVSRRRVLITSDKTCDAPGSTPSPAEALSALDAENEVWMIARRTLTERQFQALELKAGAGLSIAETAAAMGLTQSHVKVLLFRARKSLIAVNADAPLRAEADRSASKSVERRFL